MTTAKRNRDRHHPLIADAVKTCGTQAGLAKAVGSSQQTVCRLLNQQTPISAEMASAIDRATGGAVPRWKLRPDLWDAPGATP